MVTRRTVIKSSVAVPFAGGALLAAVRPGSIAAQDLTVIVGSKDFTEQFILGNMYIQVLEDMGIATEDSTNLGGTQIAQQALEAGDIHLYPEYTGTGLTEVLGLSVDDVLGGGATPEASPVAEATPAASGDASQAVYDAVKTAYMEQFGLVWLERSPANNTQALAVKRAFSEENGITTISQLAEMAGDLIISAPADFPEREDGLLGLQRVYNSGFADIEVLPVAPGLKYQALQDDQAQVVLAFGTDGQIAGFDLVVLEDDLSLWPPYNIAPVVRQEVLDAYPDVEARFNDVTTSLTDEVLSDLNWRVDGDAREDPADVATAYLTDNGFIGG
ncbi:MAG: quaternary ammonium transporter [Chloroflexia bacterium]|nr:quaternary ammonium transporter [Chloroflexia bacterium]